MRRMKGKQRRKKTGGRTGPLALLLALWLFSGCALDGGQPDGGDSAALDYKTDPAGIAAVIDSWSGVWYSRAGGNTLDGYRIGRWKDRHALIPPEKAALFPGLDLDDPRFLNYSGMAYPAANDFPRGSKYPDGLEDAYFILYDDTVYESQSGDGGNGGW
jgi:hypothetical protein